MISSERCRFVGLRTGETVPVSGGPRSWAAAGMLKNTQESSKQSLAFS